MGWVAGRSGDDDDARAVIVHAAAAGDSQLALRAYATIPSSETFPRLLPLPALARLDPSAARSALDAVREAESDAPELVETLAALGELDAARDHVRSLALGDGLRALDAAPELVDEGLAAWLADQSGQDPPEEATRLGRLALYAWRAGDREASRARFDAQLDQAAATEPDSRWLSFGQAVRDRLATGDVPFAAAIVTKAPVASRAPIVREILEHLARAGDRGGMVASSCTSGMCSGLRSRSSSAACFTTCCASWTITWTRAAPTSGAVRTPARGGRPCPPGVPTPVDRWRTTSLRLGCLRRSEGSKPLGDMADLFAAGVRTPAGLVDLPIARGRRPPGHPSRATSVTPRRTAGSPVPQTGVSACIAHRTAPPHPSRSREGPSVADTAFQRSGELPQAALATLRPAV